MIRFLADEDFDARILRGVERRIPGIDIARVQDVGLRTLSDPKVLEFAAADGRIVLTHDVSTMRVHATARMNAGKPMTGVFEINQSRPIGSAIDAIVFVSECSRDDEWDGLIKYLPL